jgi:branched-chain amino acid transport system substrate-binding protein
MTAPLSIGFLTPYSSTYPYYSQHMVTGWLLGMELDPVRQRTVQFTQEYTNLGGARDTEAAARKLLFFNRVDIISGLISYKAIPDITPLVDREKKPAFFFDMGEHVPFFPLLHPDIFYASHQLWQSQYALGYWAQKTYGNGGHLIMPIYEAGYHLNSTFQQGAAAAGGTQMQATVIPYDQNDPNRMELGGFFDRLKKDPPPYVHAIFSGNLGILFLKKWLSSGFHKNIPLLVQETMAYDDIIADIKHIDLELYTAQQWIREAESKPNQVFVKKFEHLAKQPANIYSLLGYEAGLIWKEVLPHALKRDWDTVKAQLREGVIAGPRGEKNFFPRSGFALPTTNILRLTTSGNKTHKLILDQGKGMRFDAQEFELIHRESDSGWQNPFLCY